MVVGGSFVAGIAGVFVAAAIAGGLLGAVVGLGLQFTRELQAAQRARGGPAHTKHLRSVMDPPNLLRPWLVLAPKRHCGIRYSLLGKRD